MGVCWGSGWGPAKGNSEHFEGPRWWRQRRRKIEGAGPRSATAQVCNQLRFFLKSRLCALTCLVPTVCRFNLLRVTLYKLQTFTTSENCSAPVSLGRSTLLVTRKRVRSFRACILLVCHTSSHEDPAHLKITKSCRGEGGNQNYLQEEVLGQRAGCDDHAGASQSPKAVSMSLVFRMGSV